MRAGEHGQFKIKLKKIDLHLNNFRQIKYIYDTDNKIKALFYPILMQLETALKNLTIEIVTYNGGKYLNSIFSKCLINHKTTSAPKKLQKVISLRGKLDNEIIKNTKTISIKHYRINNKMIPLWAIFQLITLGEFGAFLSCLNKPTRKLLETTILGKKSLKSMHRFNHKYNFMCKHIYIIKDLRNAVMHNEILFDCRFRGNNGIDHKIFTHLENEFNIHNIRFRSIVDYLILMIFYQCRLRVHKRVMKKEIKRLKTILQNFKHHENRDVFNLSFEPDAISKLNKALRYISNK